MALVVLKWFLLSTETGGSSQASTISPKDDISLLNINIDSMVRDSLPDMDSNDVDEIFKGVLTDDSQVILLVGVM